MKQLTGHSLKIASGQTDLPAETVRTYRELFAQQGFELPPLGDTPSLLQQAANLTRAIAKHTADFFRRCSSREIEARLAICQSCPFFDGQTCTQCGCPARRENRWRNKLAWRSEACPVGKWPALSWWAGKPTVTNAAKPSIKPPSVTRAKEVPPMPPKHVTRWAVGITTAPRPVPTIGQCVNSLIHTGFQQPTVFADNNVILPEFPDGVRVIRRPETVAPKRFAIDGPKFGAWANFVQMLSDLLILYPEAQAIFTVQDDVGFCLGLKEFLERDLWPNANVGLVSPYCPNEPGHGGRGAYIDDKTIGCRRVTNRYLIAGQTYIFPRHVVEQILAHDLSANWRGRFRGRTDHIPDKKALDAYIGEVTRLLGLRRYFYNPSLAEHLGGRRKTNSSLAGHGRHVGFRRAGRFVGFDAVASEVFRGHGPWVRYDQPSGDQRFPRPRPDVSGEKVAVVIPAVDSLDLTTKCLEHLQRHRGDIDVQVIYVDNGSAADVADQVEQSLKTLQLSGLVIRNAENLGFTRACNQGIAAADDRHVLLLDNDCFVGPNCLPNLIKHLVWHPRVAAVTPLTGDQGANSLRRRDRRRHVGIHVKRLVWKWDDPAHCAQYCRREHVSAESVLPFFCALLHREALREVGPLDESFRDGLAADDE